MTSRILSSAEYTELKNQIKQEVLAELGLVGHRWVGIDAVIEETGWGRSTIEKWRNEGCFMTMRKTSHGKVLYDLNDVQRFLRQKSKQKVR